MKKVILLLVYFAVSIGLAISQTVQIKGLVVDEPGDPVVGASVVLKGTTVGTVTDHEGAFSLNVPAGKNSIVFSYLGMRTQELPVSPNLKVVMQEDSQSLEEVVVVAYGTAKKSSFTGSAEMIKADKIEKRSVSNLSKAIEGVVTGVQTSSGGGQPGSSSDMNIRGIGSINASSAPLYVVDGAPYEGDLNAINPSDIESISILKDASSATLYGARGANGVIMITTKKGTPGKTAINFKAIWGTSSRAIPNYETVNEAEYMEMAWEALRNQYLYKSGNSLDLANAKATAGYMDRLGGEIYNPFNIASTDLIDPNTGKIDPSAKLKYHDDWLKEAQNENPLRQEYQLSITGGTDKNSYLMSLGYVNETGLLKNSNFERYSGRLNLDSKFINWLYGGMNAAFSETKQCSVYGDESAYSNVWYTALNMAPIYPVYVRDADGDYVLKNGEKQFDYGETRPYATDFNTIATLVDDKQTKDADNLSTRFFLEIGDKKNEHILFLKDFKLQINFNADYRNRNEMLYWNPYNGNGANYHGLLSKENNRMLSYTFNQLLYYQKKKEQHDFEVLAGHEFFSRKYSNLSGERMNFPFPDTYELNSGAIISDAASETQRYYVESYLSRINYNYMNKYYLSGSFRTDGSSRFSRNSHWGTFWSLGAAWRISEEIFMKKFDRVDNLTLKFAYGQQGNDALDTYYAWQGTYDTSWANADSPGAMLSSLENKDISWEKNNNLNVGIESRLLKNRLWLTIEMYQRYTKDLLFLRTFATSTGFNGYNDNIGDMKNNGFDLTIGGQILKKKNLTWDMMVLFSRFTNEVTKLNNDNQEIISGSKIIKVGEPVDSWYVSQSAGVDPMTGKQLYWYEENGERIITDEYTIGAANRFVSGSRIPDFYGSISSELRYRGFDFSILTTYSVGGKELDLNYYELMGMRNSGTNWHKDMDRRWKQPGDITNVPRLLLGNVDAVTDRYLIDASYFSIKNIALGYTLSKTLLGKVGIKSLHVFAVGDNLATFTHLKGMDPQNNLTGGQDYTYVPVRVLSLGVDINF